MDYRTHQRRLLPALATTYALSFAQQRLVDELHEVFTTDEPSEAGHEFGHDNSVLRTILPVLQLDRL